MRNPLTLLAAVAGASLLAAGPALAYPSEAVGTWPLRADNTQALNLIILKQGSVGACPQISGVLGPYGEPGPDTVVGYYCPATGQISFLRNAAGTGATYQVFTGQLSAAGQFVPQMTGSFLSFDGGNNNGAFSFWANNPG
jgi:hypothetical protein